MNHLNLTKIEKLINRSAISREEKEELWFIVTEIVHHRITGCVLDNLEKEHHEDFLTRFSKTAINDEVIEYLETKGKKDITDKIRETIFEIETEILKELQ